MKTSLKIVLHTRVNGDGTQAVTLQCIHSTPDQTIWKRRTLCRVKASQFDKASGRVIKHPNQTLYNVWITKAFNEAEARLLTWQLEGIPIDPAKLIGAGETSLHLRPQFLAYGRQYVERCRLKGMTHTAEKYGGHLSKLAEYLGKDPAGNQQDIALDDLTEDWLLKWSVWLRNHGTKSANTLHRRMAFINTLFLDAIKRNQMKVNPMAFLAFKGQRVRKPKLTIGQLEALQAVDVEGRMANARNTFLLQFFAYGSRISDALNWKKADVHRRGGGVYLEYTSLKTKSLISVRLHPFAVRLIEHYEANVAGPFLLPWLADFRMVPTYSDQQNHQRLLKQISAKTCVINAELKAIGQRIGLPLHLTTHIARHSFATLADSRIADKRKISAALGHSKFATTELYLAELQPNQVSDVMAALWQ